MRILIVGASSKKSIGYLVGECLKKKGHNILYASRRGSLGEKCDLLIQADVLRLFRSFQPEVVIHAAGVFTRPQRIGKAKMHSKMADHILAKSYGTLALLDAARRTPGVRHAIALGGRAVSSDPGLAIYTAANGALWALTQFAAQHLSNHFATYYVDLPLIENSTMARRLFPESSPDGSVSAGGVAVVVEEALRGQHQSGRRIVLGEEWTI
ncbi:MAG TPA: NAD-dependent epimerase/dehydratase family protein [Candidatus Paceibacterota bacterium]